MLNRHTLTALAFVAGAAMLAPAIVDHGRHAAAGDHAAVAPFVAFSAFAAAFAGTAAGAIADGAAATPRRRRRRVR